MSAFTWLCVSILSFGVSLIFIWSVVDFIALKKKMGEKPEDHSR
jgi:hypothetical protein